MGITRKLSHDPNKKYLPNFNKKNNIVLDENKFNPSTCRQPTVESTLLSNPPQNLRGTGWNRFEWLCLDPQDRVLIPFDHNINNRIDVNLYHKYYYSYGKGDIILSLKTST